MKQRWKQPLRDIAVISLGLFAVSFLPPDTSLSDVKSRGVIRLCVPDRQSPLIGADSDPGPELRQMQAVAAVLRVRLQVNEVPDMGRSFNPRNWQLTRGQCDLVGGGLAVTGATRDFLTLLPNGGRIELLRFGEGDTPVRGIEVGVLTGAAGLDRVRLSGFMRAEGWRPRLLENPAQLAQIVRSGGQAIASSLTELPEDLPRHALPPEAGDASDLAFGLWRGDVTLTRAVRNALEKIVS